jgi:LacI family transcriptional regulator
MGVLHRQTLAELKDSPVYFMIFMEIQAECSRNGVALEFLPVTETEAKGAAALRRLARQSGLQALVVLDWWRSEELVEIQRSGLHVIVPGPFQETVPLSFVCPNEYLGACAVTRHLLGLGHPAVAMVNSRKDVRSTTERWAGWLAGTGLSAEAAQALLYRVGRADPHGGQSFDELCDELAGEFKRRKPPSALFARDGYFAYAALTALARLGLRCPDDISVGCVGGYYERSLGLPSMTAARVEDGALGRAVVRLAQDLISGRQEGPVGIVLPMHVTEGESARGVK